MYSIDEIQNKIVPVAKAFNVSKVYIFGSYARNEATPESDIDFLVDISDSAIHTFLDLCEFYSQMKALFDISIDIVTPDALKPEDRNFIKNIEKDKIIIYDRKR